MKKVVAITGMNGFIGKHLADYFFNNSYYVVGIPHEMFGEVEVFEGETLPKLQKELESIHPNIVIHLASYGNHYKQNEADQMLVSNVMNNFILVEACGRLKLERLINFSTSSVYGKADNMTEETLVNPNTMYGATKAAGELIMMQRCHDLGIPITSIRPASIYGEGEADNRFIPTVIRNLITGGTMELASSPTHSWTYVGDLVNLVETIIHANPPDMIINATSERLYSNLSIVCLLEAISGKRLEYTENEKMRSYDQTSWKVMSKFYKLLNYKPKTAIREGLKKTYEYYKKRYANQT